MEEHIAMCGQCGREAARGPVLASVNAALERHRVKAHGKGEGPDVEPAKKPRWGLR